MDFVNFGGFRFLDLPNCSRQTSMEMLYTSLTYEAEDSWWW